MLESHAENSAQVQEYRRKLFCLLVEWRLILFGNSGFWH
jgi:hypothetical protein